MQFFFNDTSTTEFYPLSLHDALPIFHLTWSWSCSDATSRLSSAAASNLSRPRILKMFWPTCEDRKSTRLNSSHMSISYAVFCLKKKNLCADEVLFSINRNAYRLCSVC